jgi:hypothetical protein
MILYILKFMCIYIWSQDKDILQMALIFIFYQLSIITYQHLNN